MGAVARSEGNRSTEELHRAARGLHRKNLTVSTHVMLNSDAAHCNRDYSVAASPRLLAVEGHAHGILARQWLKPTDTQLAKQCATPLLIVKGGPIVGAPVILAAVASSPRRGFALASNERILREAQSLAETHDGSVHVVHVYQDPEASALWPSPFPKKSLAAAHARAARRFQD